MPLSHVYTTIQDVVLGLGFLALAAGSMKRLMASAGQSGSETVITTFYSLILFTSLDRALWFFIPKSVRCFLWACVCVCARDLF